MGLLEDAIRDHLDLKRKHGASHEELVREEADALGPARRDQLPAEQPAAEPAVDEPAAEDDEAALPHEPASHEPVHDRRQRLGILQQPRMTAAVHDDEFAPASSGR